MDMDIYYIIPLYYYYTLLPENEEIEPLSENAQAILHYIQENEGKTNNDVANAMDDPKIPVCSRMTTYKEIKKLKKANLIYAKNHNKPNNKTQRLYINNEDVFNKINKQIEEIQNILSSEDFNRMNEKFWSNIGKWGTGNHNIEALKPDDASVVSTIWFMNEKIKNVLYNLINRIGSIKMSDDKSTVLYSKVVNLMKLITFPFNEQIIEKDIEGLRNMISRLANDNSESGEFNLRYISYLEEMRRDAEREVSKITKRNF